jgi:DNA invertase Pin-like site-specific DNA recombinase
VHGWDIYKEYAEEESGSTANREQFKKLFADAHQRKFDLVLFWSLDRFSHEGALPTLQHLNLLESYGVGYKSYTEQYLDSTGIFKDAVISILAILAILAIVAKQERVRLSERTRAGIERAKSKGTKLGKPGLVQEQIDQIRRLKGGSLSNYAIHRQGDEYFGLYGCQIHREYSIVNDLGRLKHSIHIINFSLQFY